MRRARLSIVVAAVALVALSACNGDDHDSAGPQGGGDTTTAASPSSSPTRVANAPLDGSRTHAVLRVATGFGSVQIVAAGLGGHLVEASGAADATAAPVLTPRGGTVTITQPQDAPAQPLLVVRLARSVTWLVELDGGSSSVRLDLGRGRLAGVQVTQGVSSLVLTLPAPTGTLPVELSAGASSVRVRVLGGAPVRATMGGGAGTVTLYGVTSQGISAGTRLASPGWGGVRDRIDVSCSAGVSSLVVDRA